jgi:hypothetical protein
MIIHVKLLMAVEEGQPRIIRDEIYFDSTVRFEADHVLKDTRNGFSCNTHDFKTVAMGMRWMRFATGIEESQTVPFALFNFERAMSVRKRP